MCAAGLAVRLPAVAIERHRNGAGSAGNFVPLLPPSGNLYKPGERPTPPALRPAVVPSGSHGTTIEVKRGENFSGYLGSIQPAQAPNIPSGPVTTPTVLPAPEDVAAAVAIAVRIDWGDGKRSNATIERAANGSYSVLGDHTYDTRGTYRIRVDAYWHYVNNPIYQGPPVDFLAYITPLGHFESKGIVT